MKYTEEQIISGLRTCVYGDCGDCTMHDVDNGCNILKLQAADLIKELISLKKTCIKTENVQDKIKVMLDDGAKAPVRAHSIDAGLDLFAPTKEIIFPHSAASFDTGVHVEIPVGYVGMLKSKSGLNVKHGITSEGVIDAGYTGSIVGKLFNNSDELYTVNAGDKITQLVILPIITPEIEIVDAFEETERGNGGFGSTGK